MKRFLSVLVLSCFYLCCSGGGDSSEHTIKYTVTATVATAQIIYCNQYGKATVLSAQPLPFEIEFSRTGGSVAYVTAYFNTGNTSQTVSANVYVDNQLRGTNSHTTYTDWFLPSKDELNKMYVNLHSGTDENAVTFTPVGSFINENYWSSTENNATTANSQDFTDGTQSTFVKTKIYVTRAARTFVDTTAKYALRDAGPEKGYIFYEDTATPGGGNSTFYETSPGNLDINCMWSNITDTAVGAGAQNTALGTGAANTAAITAQAGHTVSIADYASTFDDEANVTVSANY